MSSIPESAFAISVIVPTHNRGVLLRRTLGALSAQTYPADQMELIVVADGCTDSTLETLQAWSAPFSFRVIAQPRQGPAAARNTGARQARGTVLLFLDDDVEGSPGLVEAHARAHSREPDGVVIGYLPPLLDHQRGLFRVSLRRWWEARFDALRQPWHRFHAFDLLSGNFSIGAELFHRIGGFDPNLRCHEDYELGLRLMERDVPFVFAPEAAGYHREHTDLHGAFRRKIEEGRADVALSLRYPAIRPALPLARLKWRSWRSRLLFRLAFAWPAGGDLLASAELVVLNVLDRFRMRARWRRLLDDLLAYWYWRGIAAAVGSRDELADWRRQEPRRQERRSTDDASTEMEIDLRAGVGEAERLLDAVRPTGVRLRYDRHPIGRILPQPGAERLHGAHLRYILARHLAKPLLGALAQEGVIGAPFDVDGLLALCATPLPYSIPGIEPA